MSCWTPGRGGAGKDVHSAWRDDGVYASDAQHIVSIRFVDHWLRAQDEASESQEDLHEVRIRNPAALEDPKMRRCACDGMRVWYGLIVFVCQLTCGKVHSLWTTWRGRSVLKCRSLFGDKTRHFVMPLYTQGRTLERWAQITCEADIFCHMENMEDLVVPSLPACSFGCCEWVKSHSQPMIWFSRCGDDYPSNKGRAAWSIAILLRFCPDGVLAWEILQEITAERWGVFLQPRPRWVYSLPKKGAYCTPVSDKLVHSYWHFLQHLLIKASDPLMEMSLTHWNRQRGHRWGNTDAWRSSSYSGDQTNGTLPARKFYSTEI